MTTDRIAQRQRVVAAYLASKPTARTSKSLVEEIAEDEKLTPAKVRSLLADCYVPYTKRSRVLSDEGDIIRSRLSSIDPQSLEDLELRQERYRIVSELSNELLYTQTAIFDFARTKGFLPESHVELKARENAAWENEKRQTQEVFANFDRLDSHETRLKSDRSSQNYAALVLAFLVLVPMLAFISCVANYDPDAGKSYQQMQNEQACDTVKDIIDC